ncbi:putative non-ribosomal peptide synthetase [Pseudomonas putida S610]|nr:putative non-ribosomal peptide synthetase [Pseudomonas putida S610]
MHKALGRQLRAVQVTTGNPRTPDVQLARHAQRHQLQARIEHVQPGVVHRFADVQGAASLHGAGACHDRGFGGAIVVHYGEALSTVELAQAVTANQQGAQRGVFQVVIESVFGHRRG